MSETLRDDARPEPLSWLTLERYTLGELSPDERVRVAARLLVSAEDRACLASIREDRSELPPLPVPPPRRRDVRSQRWLGVGGALSAAAALMLVLLRDAGAPSVLPPPVTSVKGGQVALVVVSEHGNEQPSTFAQGERFKVFVSCPPTLESTLHLLIYQAGMRDEPLRAFPGSACGNHRPFFGAFALTGRGDVEVCVAWGARVEATRSASELGEDAVCTRLSPR